MQDLDRRLRAETRTPTTRTGSVHLSLIRGGQEMSSYPERCSISIERRTVPGETVEQVEAEMQAILAAAGQDDPDFHAECRTTLVREPFEVPKMLHCGARCVNTRPQHGRRSDACTATHLDGRRLLIAAKGIPTVVFGPSGAGAHAVEEWADLESVQRCADILLAVATEFCA